MSTDERNRAWVEVRTASLLRNFRRIRDAVGSDVRVLPMVKADAYGLGAEEVCRVLAPEGVAGWGVASIAAGRRLRDAGILDRVVVFTPLAPGEEPMAREARLEVVAGSVESVARAIEAGLRVHLEIDTGMGRAGIPLHRLELEAARLRDMLADGGRWAGIFTHLHSADEPGAPGVASQLRHFRRAVERLHPPEGVALHVANSAGALLAGGLRESDAGESARDLAWVRPGIHLYGGRSGPEIPAPDPVVAVRARIVRVEELEPGATVGYGATWRATQRETIATLAIGYGDGISRALSNGGSVLVRGVRCPIVGRISMDMITANISGVEGVRVGDVATLIGRDGDAEITIDDIAAQLGTIPYEILTGLSRRLPRIWEAE